MSSMTRLPFLAIALVSTTSITPPAFAQDAASWDRARADLIATAPTQMAQVIARWEYLIEQRDLPFNEYASFLLAYPDFPQSDRLRERAEIALDESFASPENLVAYFDALPPVTFDLGMIGWAPTLELTAHVRAKPAPGWLKVQHRTRNFAGGMFEEDCEVWDSTGRLVAQSRQLALAPRTG